MRLYFTLLLLLSSPAFSQQVIRGQISDTRGNAMPGVNIFIKGTYDGVSSGDKGAYIFETDSKGTQILVF